MRFKVQLPDYPCHHVVTGLTVGRGASGKRLLLADAVAVRSGIGEHRCTDLVKQMLLHDAVARVIGVQANRVHLYGASRENQARSVRRIAGATVEDLTAPATSAYEKAARAAGFTIRAFGKTQKIARYETDGVYVVSENGWRYACEDAELTVPATVWTTEEILAREG